ncbi:MAG: biotin-independent malonate decarboxylase subunit beta [Enterobacterales bacterium]|nr:biotin-independent malonate decarboxylase subunit beta [Enterobacterales bacterium]
MRRQLRRNDLSFIELSARERARRLLDAGTFRELLGPFEHITSPWLEPQGIVTQADDGMVVAKGTIEGKPAVVVAVEGAFQGGSMGEVSGAKMASALELAAEDNRNGIPTQAVLLLETGGVRLQEANLGLAAIADIHAAIVDLRRYTPVVGIVAGTVGCFGGMSIAAALCSYLIVTREARLGLNGPQVIEQEAGIEEYDSRDRPFIWSMTGGDVRYRNGFVDVEVPDGLNAVKQAMNQCIARGVPEQHRSDKFAQYLTALQGFDTRQQATAELAAELFSQNHLSAKDRSQEDRA